MFEDFMITAHPGGKVIGIVGSIHALKLLQQLGVFQLQGRANEAGYCFLEAARRNTRTARLRVPRQAGELGGVKWRDRRLSDYRIETCRGWQQCFEKGRSSAPERRPGRAHREDNGVRWGGLRVA